MILIGLTGTIGSGKTFALNFFKSKKITVFSADEEVKKILNIKIIKDKIYKLFPEVFFRKKLNKIFLASVVFGNKKKLKKLEKIIHPIVEKKKTQEYDYIILMNVNKKIQRQRVMKRKNVTPQLLKKILSNQISDKKKKHADFIINNNGKKIETKQILKKILNKILSTSI